MGTTRGLLYLKPDSCNYWTMRNWIFILFWGFVASACAVQTPSGTQPPLQDPTADIDLFLSTDDPAKEHQIVERLKKNNILEADFESTGPNSGPGKESCSS